MMAIQHHVNDELLIDYAAGSLSEGWSLAVATHLALCPSCRKRLSRMESAAGHLLEEIEVDTASDASWAAMRKRIEKESDKPLAVASVASVPVDADPVLPEPLRSYLGGDAASLKWRPLGRGAYHIPIPTLDTATKARLLRIPAGKPVPEHSHGGRELTLVLKGSFRDGNQVFARGDLEDADATLTHQPVATPEEDCICLAVTDAPLKFRSWLLRLVQPVLGI
jgi:putative transcriptional regulator